MNNVVHIIEIHEPLQYGIGNQAYNIDVNCPNILIDRLERTLVHELKTDTDIRPGQKCAVAHNYMLRVAFAHDLNFAEN